MIALNLKTYYQKSVYELYQSQNKRIEKENGWGLAEEFN